jgi:hypothetical protein
MLGIARGIEAERGSFVPYSLRNKDEAVILGRRSRYIRDGPWSRVERYDTQASIVKGDIERYILSCTSTVGNDARTKYGHGNPPAAVICA